MFKYILISLIILFSCTNKKRFTNEFEEYPTDLDINTQFDEISPCYCGGKLYFTSVYNIDGKENFEILSADYINSTAIRPKVIDIFYGDLIPHSTPYVYENPVNGLKEVYFSAKKCDDCDYDLYYTFQVDDYFAPPVLMDSDLNSEYNETQPTLSSQGDKILFVSDKKGGVGKDDLYLSLKNKNGVWQKPVNLGIKINTIESESTPSFNFEDDFYFSSNGHKNNKDYDIYKVKFDYQEMKTESVDNLLSNINTNYNEKSFSITNDGMAFYSSDKNGNYDIFLEPRCLNSVISFNFINDYNLNVNGKLIVKNELGEEIINENISNDYVEYELMQDNSYYISYESECFPNFKFEKEIYIPCSEVKDFQYNYDIIFPEIQKTYDLEEYNIPFFVTGYYYPNTIENLNKLRLSFIQNRFSSDSTNYVKEPTEKYDAYAKEIEGAFKNLTKFLDEKLEEYNSDCMSNDEYLKITVIGFADPRVIAKGMKYFGPSIYDNSVGLKLDNGMEFNNLDLSKLRAYHTANEIKERLKENPLFEKYENKFIWLVKGKGGKLSSENNLDLSRRVLIKVESIPYENN